MAHRIHMADNYILSGLQSQVFFTSSAFIISLPFFTLASQAFVMMMSGLNDRSQS